MKSVFHNNTLSVCRHNTRSQNYTDKLFAQRIQIAGGDSSVIFSLGSKEASYRLIKDRKLEKITIYLTVCLYGTVAVCYCNLLRKDV